MSIDFINFLEQRIDIKNNKPESNDKYIFITSDSEITEKILLSGFIGITITNDNVKEFTEFINKNQTGTYLPECMFMLASLKSVNDSIAETMKTLCLDNIDKDAWKLFNQKDKNQVYFKNWGNFDTFKENITKYVNKCEGVGNSEINCNLEVAGNSYCKNGIPISNFIVEPIEVVKFNGRGILYANFKTDKMTYKEAIEDINLSSLKRFKEIMVKECRPLYFKGNDKDFEDLRYLYNKSPYPIKNGVRAKGLLNINNQYHFVDSSSTIDCDGNINNDYVFAKEYEVIKTDILKFESITATELKTISDAMFKFNEFPKTLIIWGFCFGCLAKQILDDSKIRFPQLWLIGEAGSGKSTTINDIIQPFFSLVNTSFTAKNITKFTAIRAISSSNTLPCILDEFKPYEMSPAQLDMLLDVFRNAYDGNSALRGKFDQSIEEYRLTSPIVIAGEAGSNQASIIERGLIIRYSKNAITEESTQAIKILKENKDLTSKLGHSALISILRFNPEIIIDVHRKMQDIFSKEIKDSRIVNSLSICGVGISILALMFESANIPFPVNGNKIPSILTEYIINKMLGTDEQTKSAVDRILEYMDLVMSEEPNYEGLYYDFNKDKTKLYLDTLGFYGEFTKYIGSHYIKDVEVLSRADFNTQLRDSRYFIDYKACRFKKLKNNKKSFILNIDKLNEKLELRTFNPFGENPFEEVEENSNIKQNDNQKIIQQNIIDVNFRQ